MPLDVSVKVLLQDCARVLELLPEEELKLICELCNGYGYHGVGDCPECNGTGDQPSLLTRIAKALDDADKEIP